MTTQRISHHGFRYCADVKSQEELEDDAYTFEGWVYFVLVLGVTLFFFISFALL